MKKVLMYSISMDNKEFLLILNYYNQGKSVKFQAALESLLLPLVKDINHGIDMISDFYREENNIVYIEKVMEDSLAIIALAGRTPTTIHDFEADLKFSLVTVLNLFSQNTENMDICADYLMTLHAICDFCDQILSHIIDNRNDIYNTASASVIECKNSMESLYDILLSQLNEMDQVQTYSLGILNRIKKVQYILQNQDNQED